MESNFARAALPYDSALSKITLRNQLNSPLLRLPAEIRNKIYTFVSLSTTIKVTEVSESSLLKCILCLRAPDLVRSCKQIQHEATTLLYSLATFDVTNHSVAFLLGRVFNRNICSLITSIKMSGYLAFSVMSKSDSAPRSWRDNRTPAGCLPSLKSVYVQKIYCEWKNMKDLAALRKWFGDESLEIIFEEYAG
ncbi:hypothetical protein J4E81_008879 [Alternaria sp. BMP 2799]|nr:hypothetical protein J4E81_008879 [Alternaria sp. BMP 2799]